MEGRAIFTAAFKEDTPTHLFNEEFGDGQPQTGTSFFSRIGGVGLGELLKHTALELSGNTRATVADLDVDVALFPAHRNVDTLSRRRELDRIGKQVRQYLGEALFIDTAEAAGSRCMMVSLTSY